MAKKKRIKSTGFVGSGAKVKGKCVVHGKTMETLSCHATKEQARKAAARTRKRNKTSTRRSRRNPEHN